MCQVILTGSNINQGIMSIGTYSFYNCTSLTDFEMPDTVTAVGTYAFYNCTSMTAIKLSNKMSVLSDYLFNTCTSLETFNFPASLTQIGSYVFNGCTSLSGADLVIPEGVTAIGDYAFSNCKNITSITVPNSVNSIGNGAFMGTNPTKVTLPFIGNKRTAENSTGVFGYIFGSTTSSSYSSIPSNAVYQYSTSSYYYSYYIPKTIKEVIITNDTRIPANAFHNCSWIENIN